MYVLQAKIYSIIIYSIDEEHTHTRAASIAYRQWKKHFLRYRVCFDLSVFVFLDFPFALWSSSSNNKMKYNVEWFAFDLCVFTPNGASRIHLLRCCC